MGQPAPKPQVSGRANLVNLELALHPVSWSLPYWDSAGILGPSRDPGTGQGSWNWTGILGLDKDPGTWQGSWDRTGILGPAGILGPGRNPGIGQGSWDWTGICFRVGLEKGRAGTSSSMFSLLRRNSSKTTGGSQGSFWL